MENKPFLSTLIFGSIFILVGAFIFLVGMDIIHAPEEDVHAPLWVIAAIGIAFALAGAMVAIQGLKAGFGDHPLYKWVYNAMVVVFMLVFALPFNWVAFGPGERAFSSSVSIPFVSVGASGGELGGRLAFGCGAVVMDIFFFVVLIRALRGKDLSQDQ